MSIKLNVKDMEFQKSSFSDGMDNCVGVCFKHNKVFITNSKDTSTILEFTEDEWKAFVKGVSSEEFKR